MVYVVEDEHLVHEQRRLILELHAIVLMEILGVPALAGDDREERGDTPARAHGLRQDLLDHGASLDRLGLVADDLGEHVALVHQCRHELRGVRRVAAAGAARIPERHARHALALRLLHHPRPDLLQLLWAKRVLHHAVAEGLEVLPHLMDVLGGPRQRAVLLPVRRRRRVLRVVVERIIREVHAVLVAVRRRLEGVALLLEALAGVGRAQLLRVDLLLQRTVGLDVLRPELRRDVGHPV